MPTYGRSNRRLNEKRALARHEADQKRGGPRPTDAQMKYICRLIGSNWQSKALAEIAKDMDCSVSEAKDRATRKDASKTIDRLKGKEHC